MFHYLVFICIWFTFFFPNILKKYYILGTHDTVLFLALVAFFDVSFFFFFPYLHKVCLIKMWDKHIMKLNQLLSIRGQCNCIGTTCVHSSWGIKLELICLWALLMVKWYVLCIFIMFWGFFICMNVVTSLVSILRGIELELIYLWALLMVWDGMFSMVLSRFGSSDLSECINVVHWFPIY